VFPASWISQLRQRAEFAFTFWQNYYRSGQPLPEGYAKNRDYGQMVFIGLRELDQPQEEPFQILRLLATSPLPAVIANCLKANEASVNLTASALRRQSAQAANLSIPLHQDGPLLGDPAWPVVNCWIPLNACGLLAPSLEVMPVGLREMLPLDPHRAERAPLYAEYALDPDAVIAQFGPESLWHPVFHPGDVLLMNHWLPHRTYLRAPMQQPRLSLEIRCVAGRTFPPNFAHFGMVSIGPAAASL
jgi:hypothetical protein